MAGKKGRPTKRQKKTLKKGYLESVPAIEPKESDVLQRIKKTNPALYQDFKLYRRAKKSRLTTSDAFFEMRVKKGVARLKKAFGRKLLGRETIYLSNFYFSLDAKALKVFREKGFPSLESLGKLFLEFKKAEPDKYKNYFVIPDVFGSFIESKFFNKAKGMFTSWGQRLTIGTADAAMYTPFLRDEPVRHFKRFWRENALHSAQAKNYFVKVLKRSVEPPLTVRTVQESITRQVLNRLDWNLKKMDDAKASYRNGNLAYEKFSKQFNALAEENEALARMQVYLINVAARRYRDIGLKRA
jgi:hypothetical protein